MVSRIDSWIATYCPNLSPGSYQITSPSTADYNCIAWAAESDDSWWNPTDPDQYWPDGIPRELTLETLIQAYQTIGYVPCDRVEFEPGFQKIAIYTKPAGQPDGVPTHVVRQLLNGRWTSAATRKSKVKSQKSKILWCQAFNYFFPGGLFLPRCTSKLGNLEDIEHELDGLRGFYYGAVAQILKRPISS